MSQQVLLAVAHGSRDPEAQRCIHALTDRAARLAGGAATVHTAFVQHAQPSLGSALAGLTAEPGAGGRAIVPLLLSTGYHLTTDIGEPARAAGIPVARPLGPDHRLVPALADRLALAGVPEGTPVVLAAAGSSDPRAAAETARQAAMLAAYLRAPVMAAFASAAQPTVPEAVAALSARTGRPVAVATYLLAPGLFHEQLKLSGAGWVSGPLGDHPAVASLIVDRFRTAAGLVTAPVERRLLRTAS
jgi:sirohydrochlorin ferrochelatase